MISDFISAMESMWQFRHEDEYKWCETHRDLAMPYTLAEKTVGLMDQASMGRIGQYLKDCSRHDMNDTETALQNAGIEIMHLLCQQDMASDASRGGTLAHATTDGYTEIYASPKDVGQNLRRSVYQILSAYLGADPHGFLYRGL